MGEKPPERCSFPLKEIVSFILALTRMILGNHCNYDFETVSSRVEGVMHFEGERKKDDGYDLIKGDKSSSLRSMDFLQSLNKAKLGLCLKPTYTTVLPND